jgi:hypothetical protein
MHVIDHETLSDERKAAVLAELTKILQHPSFRGSRRCCSFLDYSVQHVLNGPANEGLKERTIGVEALQRHADYDTSEDAIVRVTANEVRKRLAQYYQDSGPSGNPTISLPQGSYAVGFQWPVHDVAHEQEQAKPPRARRLPLGIWIGLCVLAVLATAVTYKLYTSRTPAEGFGKRTAALVLSPASTRDPLWSRVFDSGHKTNIVLSDAVYREVQYFLARDVSLSEYLSPGYPNSLLQSARPELKDIIAFFGRQQTTSVGSASLAARLFSFGNRMGGDPVVRYPRHVNAREFKTDNFVLLGSRLSIPWVEMFEPALNFPLTTDQATHHFYLRNRAPQQGERTEYRESASGDETYADIALLPNLGGTGTILILNGIDMVAAESAGEFAMNGSLSRALSNMRRNPAAGSGTFFAELLIRVRVLAGTAEAMDVVATREIAERAPQAPGAFR